MVGEDDKYGPEIYARALDPANVGRVVIPWNRWWALTMRQKMIGILGHQTPKELAKLDANMAACDERERLWNLKHKKPTPTAPPVKYKRHLAVKVGKHTHEDAAAIRAAQKDKCGYCRKPLEGKGHKDHITPLFLGGTNSRRNIQYLCAPCNLSKNAKDPLVFAREIGLLL